MISRGTLLSYIYMEGMPITMESLSYTSFIDGMYTLTAAFLSDFLMLNLTLLT